MEIPINEIQIHEDAWVGGGDCGPSMEFFSRGLELANQVYMSYSYENANNISELKELDIKVLVMGMGLERCCWFSKGSLNQYEASMPKTVKFIMDKLNFQPDYEIYKKFIPECIKNNVIRPIIWGIEAKNNRNKYYFADGDDKK